MEEVDVPRERARRERAVLGVGCASPLNEITSPARNDAPSVGERIVAVGTLPTLIVIGVATVELTPSETVEPGRVATRRASSVCAGLACGRRRAVAERPGVRESAGPPGRRSRRSRTSPSSGAGPDVGLAAATATGAWFDVDVADPAQLADAERAADVRVAEVDVVQRAVGSLGQVDDVAVRPVDRAVRRARS